MRVFGILAGVFSLTLLAACGGGSSSANSNPTNPTTPTPAPSAQGVYSGMTSTGLTFETIILPNDKFYAVYGPGNGNTFYGTGIVTGQGASNNGTYTANVTDYYYTGIVNTGSISASYVAGSSISGTLSEGGVSETFSGTGIPSSEFNYNTPAVLSNITGNWTGTLQDGTTAEVTINPSGTFAGSDSGCSFSGSISPDSSNKNFFDVQLTFGGTPCLLTNQGASGVAVDYLLSDGVTRQLLAGVTGGNFGTVFVANSNTTAGTVTSVIASCNPTSITSGQTSQCTASVSGTGNFSSTVTWTASGNGT
ncbi:MAG: hypothetical protein WBS19_11310, partial [Candidatus Korobacteraceae bacterium]